MTIIDAVKRLERAGEENSKATQKLHDAAFAVAALIERAVAIDVKLPRGYKKIEIRADLESAHFLVHYKDGDVDFYVNGIGKYLPDFYCNIPPQTRKGSLQFAKDIAEGLLDEISEFLEQRKAQSEEAAALLEKTA